MKDQQQKEAYAFFNKDARNWLSTQASTEFDERANTIRQRNEYVLQVATKRGDTKRALDVGCGTGELVLDLARRGVTAIGCDFAEQMTALARKNAKKKKCTLAQFVCDSIFDLKIEPASFDIISANGFIEYINLKQFDQFLAIARQGLKKGGSLVFGSRNRLFNIFTLNEFTEYEIKEDTLETLTSEAIAISCGVDADRLLNISTVPLPKMKRSPLRTGVDVSVRLQFTPAQIVKILKKKGFKVADLSPIHIHAVPPRFKEKYPDIHGRLANLLQSFDGEKAMFIPYASTFMVHARKM